MRALAFGMFRCSGRDGWLVAAALAQGLLLASAIVLFRPGLVLPLALGASLWWGSNTVSHNHLHNPLFRSRTFNRAFSLYLTLLLGVPQSIWRARHLWHHAGETGRR